MEWYMVRCQSGKEDKAAENLKAEISINNLDNYVEEIVVPKEKKTFIRNKKQVITEKPLYSGYIMVKMDLMGELPRVIKRTNYVSQLMGYEGKYTPLTDREVDSIFGNIKKSKDRVEFIEGQEIKIINGAFANFTGSVISSNKEKVKVSVLIFGKETPVELNIFEVEALK